MFPISLLISWVVLSIQLSQSRTWACDLTEFSLSKYVRSVCKSCFMQLRDFRRVRQFLTHDASVLVISAIISGCSDYFNNSFFRNLSKFILHKLQSIQNLTASIVSNISGHTIVTI